MAKPKRALVMARCAAAAVLAAIEIYNKPQVAYREQTFALLMVNAWEMLLKARLVQQAGGDMRVIYRKERGSRRYRRTSSKEPMTIGLRDALNGASVPQEIRSNIEGLVEIRNMAAHLGVLDPECCRKVLYFGTASVQNFLKISSAWFGEAPRIPFLLAVGFLGEAVATERAPTASQKKLLLFLKSLSEASGINQSGYAVEMQVDVKLNLQLSGVGNIGITTDTAAPNVRLSDDKMLERYKSGYRELVESCKQRYQDFKCNHDFHALMKDIKADPMCTHTRKLDPTNDTSKTAKAFYNLDAVFSRLDRHYTRNPSSQ